MRRRDLPVRRDRGVHQLNRHDAVTGHQADPFRAHSEAGDEFGSATASNRVKAIGIDWSC
jgi:hypothetical protein